MVLWKTEWSSTLRRDHHREDYADIDIITKERTKDGLNKKSTFCALLIQDIFGFSELNKVASCMGILLIYLYSIFPINE